MKRLLLRISVLGTIIALGLIAIAQAQRGSETAMPGSAAVASDSDDPSSAVNPLRSPAPQPMLVETSASGSRAGIPALQEPVTVAAPQTFSLADATNTHLQPPATDFSPSSGTPVAPNFGDPSLATQPRPSVARVPQSMNTPTFADSPPAVPDFGPPAADPGTDPASNIAPRLAGAGSTTIHSLPANGTFESTSGVRAFDDPRGVLPTDESSVPHPLTVSDAQPMKSGTATPAFASSPEPNPLSGPQMSTGQGRPGVKDLEGVQSPQLVVEKIAPAEIQVGRPAIFEIHVQNVGPVAALNVEIRDEIPHGTRLQTTKPQATQGAQGGLVWKLGTLGPNEEATVEMELMPTDEGEIGSVATVHFQTEASVRTRATRPLLAIETESVDKVLKGEEATLRITISNPGTGIAENVVLEEHVPAGFRHPAGAELEYEVGDLAPGESRELTLNLEAVTPGPLVNVITARGEPSLRTENQRPIEVIAPQLHVAVQGPAKRFLECEAVYNLSVHNPGTAPAKQVELAVELPPGMEFISGTNQAYYEEATRTVHWMLEEIPVQAGPPPVQLTLMPVDAGHHKIRLVSTDDSGAKAEVEQAVHVEGIVAMYFEVADLQDPIEVGGQTLYEIRVVNQGSKEATNVRLAAELPPGLRAVAAEGPTQQAPQGNVILFQPLPRLAAKADVTYRIRAEGVQPGDLRMRVQVIADGIEQWITKEESTRVYSDQ